jgi:hypothetical protein
MSCVKNENSCIAEHDNQSENFAEVKHGVWRINCDGYYPYCSICYYEPERPSLYKDNRTPYCPMCGAKMKKECE